MNSRDKMKQDLEAFRKLSRSLNESANNLKEMFGDDDVAEIEEEVAADVREWSLNYLHSAYAKLMNKWEKDAKRQIKKEYPKGDINSVWQLLFDTMNDAGDFDDIFSQGY